MNKLGVNAQKFFADRAACKFGDHCSREDRLSSKPHQILPSVSQLEAVIAVL